MYVVSAFIALNILALHVQYVEEDKEDAFITQDEIRHSCMKWTDTGIGTETEKEGQGWGQGQRQRRKNGDGNRDRDRDGTEGQG